LKVIKCKRNITKANVWFNMCNWASFPRSSHSCAFIMYKLGVILHGSYKCTSSVLVNQ